MQSIEQRIITNISKRGRGKIIFPQDFAAYGTSNAVQKAFGRLVSSGKLIRVSQGIYCYPKIDKVLGLGILHPTFEDIAAAIAKRDKARIVPTGVFALNKLGLSTQLPMNVVYLTDGSSRKVKLHGDKGIVFKHTAKKNLAFQNDMAMLITFALRELGEDNVSDSMLVQLKKNLTQIPLESLKRDFPLIPAWIRELIVSAYE